MTAYDVSEWADFANTVAGSGRAGGPVVRRALAESRRGTEVSGVPARAAVTLGPTIAILLTAIFVATPGQDLGCSPWRSPSSGIFEPWWRALPARGTVARPNDVRDIAAPRPCGAADRGRCVVVATARRRPVLGNRFCHNGFCRRIGKRVGAARRNQTVAGPATRARFRLLHQRDPVGTTATPQMFATTGCS